MYLAKGTQKLSEFLDEIVNKIASIFGTSVANAASDILHVVVVGAHAASNTDTATEFATALVGSGTVFASDSSGSFQPVMASTSLKASTTSNENVTSQFSSPSNAPPSNSSSSQYNQNNDNNNNNIAADDSNSNIQKGSGGGTSGKKGWCYVGEDRGNRSCVQVTQSEKCMSGDIFPSQDICINPNLRA